MCAAGCSRTHDAVEPDKAGLVYSQQTPLSGADAAPCFLPASAPRRMMLVSTSSGRSSSRRHVSCTPLRLFLTLRRWRSSYRARDHGPCLMAGMTSHWCSHLATPQATLCCITALTRACSLATTCQQGTHLRRSSSYTPTSTGERWQGGRHGNSRISGSGFWKLQLSHRTPRQKVSTF